MNKELQLVEHLNLKFGNGIVVPKRLLGLFATLINSGYGKQNV